MTTMAAAVLLAVGLVGLAGTPAWAAPPANDNFANAMVVTGSFTDSLNNTEATTEAGEARCGTNIVVSHSVWYALTTAAPGTATIDTFGSNFDTVLQVFTGTSLGSLTQITCNDDTGGGQSRVTFSVTASTTYYIAASTCCGTPSGNLVVHGDFQPAGSPDLTTTVSDSADPVTVGGGDLSYTVAVANNGIVAASGVSTATTLSGASATIVSASSSQGSCTITAPTVTCALGGLAVSASASITVTVTPNAAGTIIATAVSSLTETDANPTDNTDAETTTVNPAPADIAVTVTAQPHLGILVPYLTYTLTAHNTGPGAVTSATLTASLPSGASATNLSAGCTTTTGTVTCTYGAIANGASAAKSFRVPLHLLSLGHVTVTGVRTTSAPTDPNPANDTATATCTVISILLATCP